MKTRFFLSKSIATLLATGVTLTSEIHALPQGEQVQAGAAAFDRTGPVLNITTSDRAIINYSSFNIGAGERVNFVQPSALSITLNRVVEPNPSHIFGTLQANGKIVLANPYGIFFENGSVVNVGGLIAGAGHISDADFLAGRMNFSSLTGDVENRGNIIAVNDVGLYGAHVSNEGVITSQKGSVTMAAGGSVFVGEAGGNIFVSAAPEIPKARVVSAPKPGVSNTGTIEAPRVMLAAGDMYGVAIAQSGRIVSKDITIAGAKGGAVEVSGRLDASDRSAGKTGGKIKVTGENIALRGATMDATGAAGGGEILVGGDWQGRGDMRRAITTSVDAASQLSADAVTSGNGGKVVIWADDWTLFSGAITARGGSLSGDGGRVETSGKISLGVTASALVDAGAANGAAGLWLLDPRNVEIVTGGTLSPGGGVNDPPNGPGVFTVDAAALGTRLDATGNGTNVTITTNATGVAPDDAGNITVTNAIAWTKQSVLTLLADNGIFINSSITNTGDGNVVLTANGSGGINVGAAGSIALTNGTLTANAAGGGITIGGAVTTANAGAGAISLTAAGPIVLNAAVGAANGTVNIATTGGGANTISQNASGVITAATLNLNTAGANATLNGATNSITNLGAVALGAGALNLLDAGGLTVAGSVAGDGGIALNTGGALSVTGGITVNGAGAVQLTTTAAGINLGATGTVLAGAGGIQLNTPGTIVLDGTLTSPSGTVSLTTTGGAASPVTQAATGVITAGTLTFSTANANVSLDTATNAVANLSGSAGTGVLRLLDAGGFTISAPITATGGAILTTSGALAINGAVNVGASTLLLTTSGGAAPITQTAGITAAALGVTTAGSDVTLDSTANNITTLGTIALGAGAFTLVDSPGAALAVNPATITATGGVSITNNNGDVNVAAGVTTDGPILFRSVTGQVTLGGALVSNNGGVTVESFGNLTAPVVTALGAVSLRSVNGALTLNGAVTSNAAGVTLRSNNALNTGLLPVSAATPGTGDLALVSDTGTVTVGPGGITVGDQLTISIGAGLTFSSLGLISAPQVVINADLVDFSLALPGSVGAAPTTALTLAPVTPGRGITIGGSVPGTLSLDAATLAAINGAPVLTFGSPTAGPIDIASAVTFANPTLNLITGAGITQSGSLSVGGGAGTLNFTAGGDVRLNTSGIQVGTVSGSVTSGLISVLRNGAAGTLATGPITTVGGDIVVRNFSGNLTVNGAVASGGGNILFGSNDNAGSILTLNAPVNAGAGGVGLFGHGGITQTPAGAITSSGLVGYMVNGPGAITLGADNSVTGNVTLTAVNSNVTFSNTVGFNLFGATIFPAAGLNFPVVGSGAAIRTTAGGIATLTAGGNVTQSGGADDIISAGTLNLARTVGANPSFTLNNAGNTIDTLGTVAIGQGALTLIDLGGLTIGGAATAGGGYTVTTNGGALTQNAGAAIDTSAVTSGAPADGPISLTNTGGGLFGSPITLNDALNAGPAGVVTLNASGSVIQAAGAITAGVVNAVANSVFGSVSLASATNAFDAITGSGNFGFSATTTRALTVGAGGVSSSGGSVSLTATGAASDITVANGITANSGTITLTAGRDILINAILSATSGSINLGAARDIIESVPGGVRAVNLQAVATSGQVNLVPGAANNNVANVSGSANGAFAYADANSGTVNVNAAVTSTTGDVSIAASNGAVNVNAAVTSTVGDVTIAANNGALNVNAPVTATAAGGDVTLTANSGINLSAGVTANGRVSLTTTGGSIVQATAAGVISGAELLANAAVDLDLSRGGHAVGATGFAATAATGYVAFLNNTALNLDTVAATNGVTAGGSVFIGVTTGDLTQTVNGIITAGAGLALFTQNGSIVLDRPNLVTGNVSVAFSSGSVTFRNAGPINVGLVGPLAVSSGSFSSNGITASAVAPNFVSLISDTGAITQSAGAASRISGGELRAQTTNQNVTLNNPANLLTSVGNVLLGSGRFELVDSAGGLTVNPGTITANGGVVITTTGVLNLLGNVTVTNGDIALRSTDTDITLSNTLNASGLVQLDSGGVIDQTGGTITGASLIARAVGNVSIAQVGNDVANVAGSSANGTFAYADATGVAVNTVTDTTLAPVVGLTTLNRDITVTGGGALAISAPVNAGGGIVRLQGGGSITQTALITGGSLLANATGGSVSLGALANNIASTIAGGAGAAGGSFRFSSANPVTIGAIAGDALVGAASGITTNNGDIAILSNGALALNQPVNAANGAANSGGGSGTIRLQTASGDITQGAAGSLVGNGLLVNAAGSVLLATAGATNDVITLAGRAGTGAFTYTDSNALNIAAISADGAGLGPVLPIGALSGIATPLAATLVAGGALNLLVPLASLGSLDVTGTIIGINGGGNPTVQTTGGQIYRSAVELSADAVLVDTGGFDIQFLGTVDSDAVTPRALTVNTAGGTFLGGRVGGTRALGSLTTDEPGFTILDAAGTNVNPTVRTTGAQTFNDQLFLRQDTVLASTGGGNIAFGSSVDSDILVPSALTVNTTGETLFGDGNGTDFVGDLLALASLTTDAGGTTRFNIAGSSNVTPSVTTTGAQTFGDAVVLSQTAVLTSTGAGDLAFNSTVNGPGGLVLNTAGTNFFGGDIGQAVNLASLTTDAPSSAATALPALVTTTGGQSYGEAVTVGASTLASAAGGAIQFGSTVSGNSLVLTTVGNASFASNVTLNVFNPLVYGTNSFGASGSSIVNVAGALTFVGAVQSLGAVTVQTPSGSDLTFGSAVSGPGSLAAYSGNVLRFTGDIGSLIALSQLDARGTTIFLSNARTTGLLRADAFFGPASNGSDAQLNLTGSSYISTGGSVQFNPTDRTALSRHATILSTSGSVSITAAGDFFMGREQKLLVNGGALTITAGGQATVGDLAALSGLVIEAPSVLLQGRPAVDNLFNENRKDGGLGFVSPTIRFQSGGGLSNLAFMPGITQKATFSTLNSIASVRQIAGVSLEIDRDQAKQFNGNRDVGERDAFTGLPKVAGLDLGVMQPIASGTRVTEPGDARVVFILEIPRLVDLPQETFLSKAILETLARMGIYPREATSDENITVSLRRGVFRQPIEGKKQMETAEYKVVVNRLTKEEVKKIVDKYLALAGEDFSKLPEIAKALADQVIAFQTANPGVTSLDGFTAWLAGRRGADKVAEGLAKNLDELASVLVELSRIGLTRKEVTICKLKICDELGQFLPTIDSADLAILIEGAPKPPAGAPAPGSATPPNSPPAPVPEAPVPAPAPAPGAPLPPAPVPPPPDPAPAPAPAPADAVPPGPATPATPAAPAVPSAPDSPVPPPPAPPVPPAQDAPVPPSAQ